MAAAIVNQKLRSAFPALTHRNFRLFFFGQCISLIGTWMQNIGQAWLVLQLTAGQSDAPFKLGLVTALQFLPMMLFSLFAGTFVDSRTVLCVAPSSATTDMGCAGAALEVAISANRFTASQASATCSSSPYLSFSLSLSLHPPNPLFFSPSPFP